MSILRCVKTYMVFQNYFGEYPIYPLQTTMLGFFYFQTDYREGRRCLRFPLNWHCYIPGDQHPLCFTNGIKGRKEGGYKVWKPQKSLYSLPFAYSVSRFSLWKLGFSIPTVDILDKTILCCKSCPEHWSICSHAPCPYPQNTSSTPSSSCDIKNSLQTWPDCHRGGNIIPYWEPLCYYNQMYYWLSS